MPFARSLSVLVLWVGLAAPVHGETRIDLELAIDRGSPLNASQKWLDFLKEFEFSGLRIRESRATDEPRAESVGTERQPAYRVLGIVTAQNRLHLPGGSFAFGDRSGLSKWRDQLQDGGAEALTAPRQAFGLSPQQLVATHEALAGPVEFSTLDQPAVEVASRIVKSLPLKTTVDPAAKAALAGDVRVQSEVQQMASGTALAIVLREHGLAFAPRRASGQVYLLVHEGRALDESWPVGWPPQQPPGNVLPDLFKFLNVDIDKVPLTEALEAVQGRISAPFLIDHGALAKQRIVPDQVPVSHPSGKTTYKVILDRLLTQAKLKHELRVDELSRPFIWITTQKKN